MAEPLSREEREVGYMVTPPLDTDDLTELIDRYEATVQRAEEALREARDKIEEGMQADNHFDSLEAFTVAHTLIRAYFEEAGGSTERYPLGWLEAVVHWNPESGAIHTDGNREALRALIAKAEEAP